MRIQRDKFDQGDQFDGLESPSPSGVQGAGEEWQPDRRVMSGFTDPLTLWQTFESRLPGSLHVCAYDRSGERMSPETSGPQTFTDMAGSLHRTLSAREIIGPLVLAADSVDGDVAITYAHLYPAAVRSVVLVDAVPAALPAELIRLIPPTAVGDAASFRAAT